MNAAFFKEHGHNFGQNCFTHFKDYNASVRLFLTENQILSVIRSVISKSQSIQFFAMSTTPLFTF